MQNRGTNMQIRASLSLLLTQKCTSQLLLTASPRLAPSKCLLGGGVKKKSWDCKTEKEKLDTADDKIGEKSV